MRTSPPRDPAGAAQGAHLEGPSAIGEIRVFPIPPDGSTGGRPVVRAVPWQSYAVYAVLRGTKELQLRLPIGEAMDGFLTAVSLRSA